MRKMHVALPGSGFLLPAYVGALMAMEDAEVEVASLAGTSGGAIVAAIFAVKRNAHSIAEIVMDADFQRMMDFVAWSNPFRLFFREGVCNPAPLHRFLLKNTLGKTFADVDLPLSITATDYDTQDLMVFSRATTPHVRLADAARASSSLPFVYPQAHVDGRRYMDGGLCLDIPAKLLPRDGSPAICPYLVGDRKPGRYWMPFYNTASATINAMMKSQQALARKDASEVKFVPVDTGTQDALDGSMSAAGRQMLIEAGRDAVMKALV